MPLTRMQMLQIMLDNPSVNLVYNSNSLGAGMFTIQTTKPIPRSSLNLPADVDPKRCHMVQAKPFTTLELPTDRLGPLSSYTNCQDEPIKLGTQIQPKGAPWVGTAGCPVSWTDPQGKKHWGILSNWHVFTGGQYGVGHGQHQPSDDRPACAYLSAATPVNATEPNTTDAAIADAFVNGFHTIDWFILNNGPLNPWITDALVGNTFRKIGRTTGLTHARCTAIDATARVGYGNFEALFVGQDVFTDMNGPFSAAGDSGSCIICDCDDGPSALLFAGGGNQTIGNPMRLVAEKLRLQFAK